jgi:MYXO-CTERM domain-containing protein
MDRFRFSTMAIAVFAVFALAACSSAAPDEPTARASQAISLGETVSASQFPATAALRYGDVTVGATCTGTLVAPTWVLTAAHCVTNVGTEDASQWSVTFKAQNLNNGSSADKYGVTEVKKHAEWDPTVIRLGYADVALLKLDRAVSGITPAKLHRTKVPAGTTLVLVGFGKAVRQPSVEEELSGILRAGENTTIACSTVPFDASRPEIRDDRSLCLDAENAPGTCERDSGGPAYIRVGSDLEVAGITSGSRDSALGACGKYAIYAAVSQELSFIDSVIGKNAPPPSGNTGNGGSEAPGGNGSGPGLGASGNGQPTTTVTRSGCNAGGEGPDPATTLVVLVFLAALFPIQRRRATVIERSDSSSA